MLAILSRPLCISVLLKTDDWFVIEGLVAICIDLQQILSLHMIG